MKSLADLQLVRIIETKPDKAEEAKVEWKRRWALDYPYVKTISGVKRYAE